jgi:hypothetical protein
MGFLAGIFGSGTKQASSGQQGNAYNSLDRISQAANQTGTNLFNNAQNLFQSASTALSPALSYYTSILSGNPSATMQAISPTIQASNAQYQGARNALDLYAPMGGGRAAALANLPFQQAATNANLLSQARNQAAMALPGIAGVYGGLGGTEGELGNQLFNTSIFANNSLLRNQLAAAEQNNALGRQNASGIGAALSLIPFGRL